MNRIRTTAAILALAGTAALVPAAAAGADPVISISSGGVPINEAGTVARGQALDIGGSGCTTVTPGEPTYSGLFVSAAGDPWTNSAIQPYETVNSEAGEFTWSFTVPEDNYVGTTYARFYCSTSTATALSEDMLWVGPVISMTNAEGASPNRTTASFTAKSSKPAAKTTTRSSAAASASGGGMTMTVDPNALPAIDRLGITGDKAAKLKAKVDAQYARDSLGLKLLKRLVGRNEKAAALLDAKLQEQYVATSASVLGVKKMPAKTFNAFADRLEAGEIRVTIVEDIALQAHPASWYNAR